MIKPRNELIYYGDSFPFLSHRIMVIRHPLDLREELQYKPLSDSYFRRAARFQYESIKANGKTLIFYEE